MDIIQPLRLMFFPKKPASIDFQTAIDALKLQQRARITKAALFAIATIALTAVVLLSEASLIAWPIFLPVVLVTIAVGVLFFRLNSLDNRYIEDLDGDQGLRASLAKQEIDRLFCSRPSSAIKKEEIDRTLQEINLLVGHQLFSPTFRKQVLDMHDRSAGDKTLAESAEVLGVSLALECKKELQEKGRFGLPTYVRAIDMKWGGKKADAIELTCRYAPLKQEEEKGETPKSTPEAPPKVAVA